jgi:UDP-glucuronate 4-epimerase
MKLYVLSALVIFMQCCAHQSVLVTGGAGFIGSHTCRRLIDNGYKVVCLDNFTNYLYDPQFKERNIKDLLNHEQFSLIRADITDLLAMQQVFQTYHFDCVIHLAALAGVRPSIKNPHDYEKVNIGGTLNILECCKNAHIKKFVFASSSSVYGINKKEPFAESDILEGQISPYAVTKKMGETLCKSYHLMYHIPVVCLRFFTVYGPCGRPDMAIYKFIESIKNGRPIEMYGDGTTLRDYTYVDDIVSGIVAALTYDTGFEIFNLGNAHPIKLRDLITTIEQCLQKKAIIIQKQIPTGDVQLTHADISKAKKLLGYNPNFPIAEGIKNTVIWQSRIH